MKPILFIDFDGTLCHDRFWRSLDSEEHGKIQQFLFISNKELVGEWMVGKHSSEEINILLSEKLDIPYGRLWNIFVSDCKNMRADAEALKLILKLKNRFRIILITDNMDCFQRFTVGSIGLNRYFDEIVDSHTANQLKGDKLFSGIVKKHGPSFSDCILIDNSKNMCALFESLGGKSLFVTKEQSSKYWLESLF